MGVNFFQIRKILRSTNTLELMPYRLYEYETLEDNTVNVLIQKFKNPNLQFFLLPRNKSKHIKIKLDSFGSAAWTLIDGNRNINTICIDLIQQFGESIQPVEERVSKFIFLLYNNKLISFKEFSNKQK